MKAKYTHPLKFSDMAQAQKHWTNLYEECDNSFLKFLGHDDICILKYHGKFYGTELAYRKIQMLTSPHYRTLMAVFIARTGYHKKFPKK